MPSFGASNLGLRYLSMSYLCDTKHARVKSGYLHIYIYIYIYICKVQGRGSDGRHMERVIECSFVRFHIISWPGIDAIQILYNIVPRALNIVSDRKESPSLICDITISSEMKKNGDLLISWRTFDVGRHKTLQQCYINGDAAYWR